MASMAAISKKLKKLNNAKLQQILSENAESEEEEEVQEMTDTELVEVDMNEVEGQSRRVPTSELRKQFKTSGKAKANRGIPKTKMAMIKKMLQAASECTKNYRKITELTLNQVYKMEGYQTKETKFGNQPGTSHCALLTKEDPYMSDWYYLPQATVKRYQKIFTLLADKEYFNLFNYYLVYRGMRSINKDTWQMHDVEITMEQIPM